MVHLLRLKPNIKYKEKSIYCLLINLPKKFKEIQQWEYKKQGTKTIDTSFHLTRKKKCRIVVLRKANASTKSY